MTDRPLLLDTHAWIWWVTESPRLSLPATTAITQAEHVGEHIISCWEIAMLVEKGRLKFNQKVTLLPFEPATAIQAARLQDFHGYILVSADQSIQRWGQVEVIW